MLKPGVPFEENPPPDAMPDLDLAVDALPLTHDDADASTEPKRRSEDEPPDDE